MDIVIKKEDLEGLLIGAVLKQSKEALEGWKSPLNPIIEDAFKIHSDTIRSVIYDAFGSAVKSESFKADLQQVIRHKLANLAIQKTQGLTEKAFNNLMSDQVLRTKIQSAVISLVEDATTPAQ